MAPLVLRFVAWIALPIAVVLAQLAEPVVRVIYGQKWLDVAPLLPWTMAWGALSAMAAVAYMLLLSTNRTRQCLYVDVVTLAGTAVALAVALPNGTITYVGALVGVQVLVLGLLLYWLLRCRALTPRAIFDAIAPPAIACAISWQILHRVVPATHDSTGSIVIESLVWGIVYSSLYLLTIRVGFSRQMREVVVHLPLGKALSRFLALGPN